MRDQFTFYRSFWEAIKKLKRKEDILSLLLAILTYVFEETIPPMTPTADGMFALIKPVLDSAAKKAKSGSAGGKQNKSKPEANRKQTGREKEGEKDKEGEVEVEGEVKVEGEEENECYISSPEERKESPSSFLSDEKRKYGDYVVLALHDYGALLREYGIAGLSERIRAVDLPENEGKDFAELIRGVKDGEK